MRHRQTEDGKTLRQTDRGWKDIELQTEDGKTLSYRQRMERH